MEMYYNYHSLADTVRSLYKADSMEEKDRLSLEITLPEKAYNTFQESMNEVASPVFLTDQVLERPYLFSKVIFPFNIQADILKGKEFVIKTKENVN